MRSTAASNHHMCLRLRYAPRSLLGLVSQSTVPATSSVPAPNSVTQNRVRPANGSVADATTPATPVARTPDNSSLSLGRPRTHYSAAALLTSPSSTRHGALGWRCRRRPRASGRWCNSPRLQATVSETDWCQGKNVSIVCLSPRPQPMPALPASARFRRLSVEQESIEVVLAPQAEPDFDRRWRRRESNPRP